jgi:beta-lactamase regulating signal transducer with metallopeptidase domain
VNAWIAQMNSLAVYWFEGIARVAWQGAIVLTVMWVLSRCPAIPPACKVWLWRLAFLKLLIAFFWVTPVSLRLLPANEPRPHLAAASPRVTPGYQPTAIPYMEPATFHEPLSWRASLLGLWSIGVLMAAARMLRQWRAARTLLQDSEPIADATLNETFDRLSKALGLRRMPSLSQSASVCSPMLVGVFRQRIILPAVMLASHTAAQLEMMLAHELAHVRRRDLGWLWLFTLCEALFFFHPLVWLARREWGVATESACDQLALRITKREAHDYGSMLVDVVGRLSRRRAHAVMSMGMIETATTLKRRLKAMTRNPGRLSTALGVALIGLAGLALVPCRLVAQTTDADGVAKLKEENANLRQQLLAVRAEIESLREKTQAVRGRDEATENRKRAEQELQRSAQKQEEAADRLREAERQLAELLTQFTDQHPKVLATRQEVEKLRDELQINSRMLSDEQRLRRKTANVPAKPEEVERSREHRELLAREIELAEQQVAVVRKKIDIGKETPEALLRVQRDLLDLKLKQAELGGSQAERRAVLLQQLQIAEQLLKEQKKRIEVGILSVEEAIPFEREVLRLKRELAATP